ncbi:MAG: DNA replication/repair protein RecF [Alistipes onderdonkii]
MYLKKISLLNFKNIAQEELALCPGINCLVGDNGAGKTNVIDAVYYLSMCKSSLTMTDGQSVRHGADFFLAEGQYLTDAGKTESVVCSFSRKGGKVLKRNGKEYERLSDHVGLIPAVIVSPADSALISDAADERRRYLNGFISQLDRTYLAAVMRYNGVLAERNRLLKNMPDETMLRIYDLQLVEQGNRIHALRREFTQRLQPVVADYYRTLSGDREQVELHYKSELNDRPFDELLLAARQKDLANEFTTAGIHRDDLVLKIGGYPLRKYGSQGQQKSFLIALKLAQYTIVAREKGEKPILLLDDLFDKLDAGRVEQLIRLVSEDSFGQILITDCNPTRLRTILDKAGGEYALFTVGNGAVTQGNATATAAAADPDKGSAGSRPGNAVTDGAAEPMEEKTPGQTGTAAADRTEGQAGNRRRENPAAAFGTSPGTGACRRTGSRTRRQRGTPRGCSIGRRTAMRRTKTMLMGDLLEEFFKRPYVAAKVAEGTLRDTWREIVGDRAAEVTPELKIENHILYARIQSSVLRSGFSTSARRSRRRSTAARACGWSMP